MMMKIEMMKITIRWERPPPKNDNNRNNDENSNDENQMGAPTPKKMIMIKIMIIIKIMMKIVMMTIRWERPPPTYDEAMKHVNPDLQHRPPDPPPYSDSFRAR